MLSFKGSEQKMTLNQSLDKIVKVRGYKDGLLFIIQPESTLSEVEEALTQHLSTLGTSLSGVGITLDIGDRIIEKKHLHNLQQWLNQEYGMDIKRIIMDYSGTIQEYEKSQIMLAETASKYIPMEPVFSNPKQAIEQQEWEKQATEPLEEESHTDRHTLLSGQLEEIPMVPVSTEPKSTIEQQKENKMAKPLEEKARVIRHTLRSGQREEFLEGHLVVLGDVNPGAEIVASKDIIVLGSLRGMAHAGASGDLSAVIIALNLIPTQLRIGNTVSRFPSEEKQYERGMEIARVEGEAVIVEEYKGL